jgi:hypothetical protein
MMDELELLKKDWQSKEEHLPKLSYEDIYTMLWKKSSSIVKWILIISILEIILPHLLYLIPSMKEGIHFYEEVGVTPYFFGLSIFYYLGVAFFVFQFYKNYKEISVLDDAKSLMRKIIKTRKTVKYYVFFSLSVCLVMFMISAFFIYFNDDFLLSFQGVAEQAKEVTIDKIRTIAMWTMLIGGIIITGILGGIYFLLYGLLLRKLNYNYHELKKLEV